MVPPRLRLVTSDGIEDAPEAQEAIELARALSEVEAAEADEAGAPAPRPEDWREDLRIVEALLFASSTPLDEAWLAGHLRHGSDIGALLAEIKAAYAPRGVNLVRVAGKWVFRTAEDLGYLLERHAVEERRLSRAALETLAIVAYHQPVTRAEIEEVRGVSISRGTLDVLLETGWIRMRGRRRTPGRPVTFGTTPDFLDHFGLVEIADLPGLDDLKAAGLLSGRVPPGFSVPAPEMTDGLAEDEDPLEEGGAELAPGPETEVEAEAAEAEDFAPSAEADPFYEIGKGSDRT